MDDRGSSADFLGRGWKFPPELDYVTGRVRTVSDEEDIAEAIRIIIFTRKGERVMRPDFGCGIQRFIFMEMDYGTVREMEREIVDSLIAWEPRITDVDAQVSLDRLRDGLVEIKVSYVVRSTNNPYNLVFPYYIQEGT